MISIVVSGRLLDGFLVGNTSFSHLLFADDSLIFCDALLAHLRHMRSLFLCFEAASGLKVNLAKTKLVPVGNVSQGGSLARVLGCGVSLCRSSILAYCWGTPIRLSIFGAVLLIKWKIGWAVGI
jgi:hypothetical protein